MSDSDKPQRSATTEQEWTPHELIRLCDYGRKKSEQEFLQAICDAHKAALAAEREEGRKSERAVWESAVKSGRLPELAAERQLRDEARAQREWLIKECARVGVTVNVRIGAPITEAYELVNTEREKIENLHGILGKKRVEIRELKEKLAAGRQSHNETLTAAKHAKEFYERAKEQYREQLLSAQAAIEKLRSVIEGEKISFNLHEQIREALMCDLSLLHEVRKPLVDVLIVEEEK